MLATHVISLRSRYDPFRLPDRLLLVLVLLSGLLGLSPATRTVLTSPSINPPASDGAIQFVSGGHVLGFKSGRVYLAGMDHALSVSFVGGRNVVPSSTSQTGMLEQVKYAGVWPGIDVIYSAAHGGVVESSYYLESGADVENIRLSYNVPARLNVDGGLSFAFQMGELCETAPVAWQEIAGKRLPVEVSFVKYGESLVGFKLGEYDRHFGVVIDPFLSWNTFLGSSNLDQGRGIAVDGSGNVFVTGSSWDTWGSPKRAYQGKYDAFVAKLNSSGSLIWNTFLGSTDWDEGHGIGLDGSGNIYVTGNSDVTWGSPKRAHAGSREAFVAKLDSSGGLVWNTFLGSFNWDIGYSIAVTGSGSIYVTGLSDTAWFSPKRTHSGGDDAFVAGLNSSGSLIWNTFLGSSANDAGYGIATDGSGGIYVTGCSYANWGLPVRGYAGGSDAFVARLNSSGNLVWNTFLGASGYDQGYGIDAYGSGNVFVTGDSASSWGVPKRGYSGDWDAFAARLNGSGDLVWNTFLGSTDYDRGFGITVDGSGNVYTSGSSDATWGSPKQAYAGKLDAFATKLKSNGILDWNTFMGAKGVNDESYDIDVAGNGKAHLTGYSEGNWGSPVRAYVGGPDAFVAKLPAIMSSNFRSNGTLDGWVLESTENSGIGGSLNAAATTFNLGDDNADKQYRAILSFNTSSLPSTAVISSVKLKIKTQGQVGANPFITHKPLLVDIRKPYFGASAGLAANDFQALANKGGVGIFGTVPSGGWYSAGLNSSAFAFFNKTGATQFRLHFQLDDDNDNAADYLKFFSGDYTAVSYRPELIIQYYMP